MAGQHDPNRWEMVDASAFSIEAMALLFTRTFEGYVVPVSMTPMQFARMVQQDNTDLSRSLIALDAATGEPVGLCLLTYRGRRMRIGAMAVLPAYRSRGVGDALVEASLRRTQGASTVLLEVISDNAAALRLYEKHGFQRVRTLIGVEGIWNGVTYPMPYEASIEEVDPWSEVRQQVIRTKTPPTWQLEPTNPSCDPSMRAFRLGPALCVVALGETGMHHLRVIATDPAAQGKGWASALLSRVMSKWPGATWRIPAIVPEEWGTGLYERVGMERVEFIEQFEMARPAGD